jgi:hypothetical protein
MVFEAGNPGPQRSVVLYGAIRWILPVLVLAFACTPESEFELRSSTGDLEIEIRHSRYFGDGPANNRGVAIDSQGNIIMVGGTISRSWPKTLPLFGPGGGSDATVAKFDSDGVMLWSFVFGGPDEDYAYVVDITEKDEIVVGGRAGEFFKTTPGAFEEKFQGGKGSGSVHLPSDGFVVKLDPNGAVLFSTFIGGSQDDNVRAIEVLRSGMIAVGGGNTSSPDLPTDRGVAAGPVLNPTRGGPKDAWVGVIHADGANLEFLTYFGPDDDPGGRADETIRSLAEDSAGNIWIGGTTSGRNMTPTPDAFQPARGDLGSESSAYIAKLSPDGRDLVYFSWLGGSADEEIETEGTADALGNFYVAGSTSSPDFPTTPGAAQVTLLGGGGGYFRGDGFVARIDDDGSLGFATLHGGSAASPEALFGPAVDSEGNVYVSGRVASPDMTTTVGAYQTTHAGQPGTHDAILAVFGPTGALRYSTFFGGSLVDMGRHIAVDPNGRAVVIAVETASTDIPLEATQQSSSSGAFFAYFRIGP